MVTIMDKKTDIDALKKKLTIATTKKLFDGKKHLGKVKWNKDAVAYQKKMRNEW
jgi:hypothetical protein